MPLSALLFTSSLLLVSLSFCPSCGFKYSRIWSLILWNTFWILNIGMYYLLYLKNVDNFSSMTETYSQSFLPPLMKSLSSVSITSVRKIWEKIKSQNFSKKYFTDSDIVHYGLISIIHTFGRDLKWNPHIHAIVSLGGFTKNFWLQENEAF